MLRTTIILFYCFLILFGQGSIEQPNNSREMLKHQRLKYKEPEGLFDKFILLYIDFDFFTTQRKNTTLNKSIILFKESEVELRLQMEQVIILFLGVVGLSAFCLFEYYDNQIKKDTICFLNQTKQELIRKNQLLSKSVREKNILLKEIHHRVKNNLQLVMSLLDIQAQDSQQISINEFLEKGQMRIATMALIHQTLYLSENFEHIDFQDYLENLVTNIKDTYCANQVGIVVKTNGNTFDLDTAIPLGLIVNELVCNSLKHAFPTDLSGQIHIAIHKNQDNTFELQIGDDGVGMVNEARKPKSIGLEMVSLLVKQLQGKMEMINQSGLHYRIVFAKSNEN